MVASSGEESASDAHHGGPASTMRRRRCLRRRLHHQALRRSQSMEKNPTEAPSNWPFWWLGAAAIAVFVTPSLSSAFLSPALSMHEKSMERLFGWPDRRGEKKMFCSPNYDDEHFFDAFKKPRPQGVRYRDDETLHRIAMQQYHAVYPVMVQERPRPEMVDQSGPIGGESSSGRMRSDPTLEDIDLIDVLWREDIESEKSGGAAVAAGVHPSDQVERDLQLLTEKSVQAPLTLEESSRYEDLSKHYFSDFYTSNRRFVGEFATEKTLRRATTACPPTTSTSGTPTGTVVPSTSSSASSSSGYDSSSSTTVRSSSAASSVSRSPSPSGEQRERRVKRGDFPSDAEVDALFEDLGKECGELNMLMPTEGAGIGCPISIGMGGGNGERERTGSATMAPSHPTAAGYTGPMPTVDTLMHNVSLASIAPYNTANLTEIDFMVRNGTAEQQQQQMLQSLVNAPLNVNDTNGYPAPTQFWFDSVPDGSASYQTRQPVLNMSTLHLQPIGADPLVTELQQAAAAAAAANAAAAAEDMTLPPAHHELTPLTGRMQAYETRPTARTASMSSNGNDTQSLGAASGASSSSSSPHYSSTSTQAGAGSDGENRNPRSRFYGKLAPSLRASASHSMSSMYDEEEEGEDAASYFRSPISSSSASLHSHSGGVNAAVAPRRRGRQSKDEQLAASNGLPVSAHDIAEMSLPDLQKLLKDDSLTEQQRQLIRKIRRRGKNKVAARTCRQRRGVARTEHASFEQSRILGYSNRH